MMNFSRIISDMLLNLSIRRIILSPKVKSRRRKKLSILLKEQHSRCEI